MQKLNIEKKFSLYAIFCGADKLNNKSYLIEKSEQLNINDKIIFLDHISNNDLKNLYKESFALVMPTFFGPINIPPIEGHKYKTPVIYNELFANLDYDFDYQLPINIYQENSLVNAIINLDQDKNLRTKLVENGSKVYQKELQKNKQFLISFQKKINNFFLKRETWK